MNVVEDQKAEIADVISVDSIEYLEGHKLRVRFDDGKVNDVDFGPFLRQSHHPAIRAYLDFDRFSGFKVEDGFLHWNDFDLVFPMADLYAGTIH